MDLRRSQKDGLFLCYIYKAIALDRLSTRSAPKTRPKRILEAGKQVPFYVDIALPMMLGRIHSLSSAICNL